MIKRMMDLLKNIIGILIIINVFLAILALLRDVLLANYLGTTSQADALLLALFIPDTVGNNLIAASVGVACVPVLTRLLVLNEYNRFYFSIKGVLLILLFLSLLLTLLFTFGSDFIIEKLGSGMSDETKYLSSGLLKILLPTIIMFPLFTIGSSILQVFNKFIIPAFGPILYNSVFLISILISMISNIVTAEGVFVIAIGIGIGVLSMVILVWTAILIFLRKYILPEYKIKCDETNVIERWHDIREVMKTFMTYLLILLSSQGVLLVERYLASQLEPGTIAGLNYAYRIAQFPVWVFVAAISTVIFPAMAKSWGMRQKEELHNVLLKALRLVVLITIPLTLIISTLRVPIISILLQRGAFDDKSLEITAGILAGYSLIIIGQGMITVGLRFFLAMGKILQPLMIFLLTAVITICADWYFVYRYGSPGLGYGAALGSLINVIFVYILLNRELKIKYFNNIRSVLRLCAVNIPLLLITIVFNYIWFLMLPASVWHKIAYVFAVVCGTSFIYLISLRRFKII